MTLSVQLDNREQKAFSLHHIGLAYWRMNKPEDALRNYQEELVIWRQLGHKSGTALALNEMAKGPLPDYKTLKAKYGDRFQAQDMDMVQPQPSGLLDGVKLVTR